MREKIKNRPSSITLDHTISSMFSRISPWYDFLNHFLSLGIDIYWRKRLVASIPKKASLKFLDLATGTMDVAREIEKKFSNSTIIGIDLSFKMLLQGKKKIQGKNIVPICANAKELPILSSSVDVVTMAFGIRNITPREHAYKEVLRVLRSGGQFLILEFASTKKRIWFGIYNLYLSYLLPKIGNLISKDKSAYTYLRETINKFPLAHELQREMLNVGFRKVSYIPLSYGIVHLYVAEK